MPEFDQSVFINCPFDKAYYPLFRPLIFTVFYVGLYPRVASERSDSGENRIDKIAQMIKDSKYSIHDISRIKASRKNEIYRMNMPFELGMDYGCRKFANDMDIKKRQLILEKDLFTYKQAISDISGFDIKSHSNDPIVLVRVVREWFVETVGMKGLKGPTEIWNKFNDFMYYLTVTRIRKGFSKSDIELIPIPELIEAIIEWKS